MYLKPRTWFLVSLFCFFGAVYFWRLGNERAAKKDNPTPPGKTNVVYPLLSNAGNTTDRLKAELHTADTNAPFPYRISNTPRKIDDLVRSDSAILLRNALIDTASGAPLNIPPHLRSQGDPGSYIVQSRGTITDEFRDELKNAGAEIVSYVPNNAYLVRASAAAVAQLRALPQTQAVMPWEPYFKLSPKLLALAVEQEALPNGHPLSVLTFPGDAQAAERQLKDLGATVLARERSPFGTQLIVHAPADRLVTLAQASSVQAIEPMYRRAPATDLARTRVRISTNTVTPNSHLGLMGNGIRAGVNDTGVETSHPGLAGRVFGDALVDSLGHGTHVAAILAGTGASAPNGTNAPGSTNGASFRGMAPQAEMFSQPIDILSGPLKPDSELQEVAATNGVFVCNNSWGYIDAFDYTFASALWDAAVRDSVPGQEGSQAMTFVFSAGNNGFGFEDGAGGRPDSVEAPGTAKNVITVGATEQLRNITNELVLNCQTNMPGATNETIICETNTPFLGVTDSDNQVATFSSRGNVGRGLEGEFGRFKPDVVAPGTFVVSARASSWNANSNLVVSRGYAADEVIPVGETNFYFFFGGPRSIEARIRLIPNSRSPVPFPTNSLYVRRGALPPPSDFAAPTNTLNFSPVEWDIYYLGVGNNFNQDLHCDIQVVVISTNPPTPADELLATLNTNLAPHYRFESGTSMAAPVVSGMLALMQERLAAQGMTNPSPALMKALLINGARSIGEYNLEVNKVVNSQGWGMANFTNSVPARAETVRFFDQETNGLVTGQSQTRIMDLTTNLSSALRISLVWTDPPGNPAVGTKLVNDLDLIVTNLTTSNVYVGNAISGDFSSVVGTNFVTDVINNVENVYVSAPRAGRYSVTVRARRVNVNAVTAHNPNGIAQDYALVISAGSPADGPVFNVQPPTTSFNNVPLVMTISNGVPVLEQRIGANPNISQSTNGLATQWRFYQFQGGGGTNTNVAFITFLAPNLARVRTIEEADIDLYVSTNSSLTNLNAAAVGSAWTSKRPGGTEVIALTNQLTPTTYYIGVKSEDQQASEFGFIAFAVSQPFSEEDENGNVLVRPLTALPVDIPDGSSEQAAGATILAIATHEIDIRNVIVTNELFHESGGDLIGFLAHNGKQSVLNNHRHFEGTNLFIYDDSDSGQSVETIPTDAPGTLRNFWGEKSAGLWQMVMIDDSLIATGRVEELTILLQRRQNTNDWEDVFGLPAGRCWPTSVDVPADAYALAIDVVPRNGAVDVYVARNIVPDPDQNIYDHYARFAPPGGTLEITPADSPPLSSGRYHIAVCNPNSTALDFRIRIRIERNPAGNLTNIYRASATMPLVDDAVTTALLNVTNSQEIVDVRAGVRIRHDRASDLVLTLVSPQGTRVLLAENRGGSSPYGYGGDPVPPDTDYIYTIFTDNTNLTLTPIKFAQGPFTDQICTNVVVPDLSQQIFADGFEVGTVCTDSALAGTVHSGWLVETGDVAIVCEPHTGAKALELNGVTWGAISNFIATTVAGRQYVLTHAYSKNPHVDPNFVALADLWIDGQPAERFQYGETNSPTALNWLTNTLVFTAQSNGTPIRFVSRNLAPEAQCGGTACAGMYLDTVAVYDASNIVSRCNYVLPEEPLRQFQGENAYGTWRLEVWDNRVGAPLNGPELVSWQLEFDFLNTNPPAITLSNMFCYPGVAYGTNPVYFRVQVPFLATAATNTLLNSSSGEHMILGADVDMLPRGMQPPDDYAPVITNIAELVIGTGSNPRLPQGQTYYLVVQNTNALSTNQFQLCVSFDRDDTNDLSSIIPIASGQCITNLIQSTNLLDYYSFDVHSNAVELAFELRNDSMSGNVDMVINQGLPLPNHNMFFAQSTQPGTMDDIINVTNYNQTLGGRWYIGIYNRANMPVRYSLCVRQVIGVRYANVDVCTTNLTIPLGGVQYFRHTVSPIALRTHFTVSNIFGGNVDMFVADQPPFPPPSGARHLIAGTNPGTTPEIAALSLASTPALFPNATYYIAITNKGADVARYDLCIYDFPSYEPLTNASCVKSTLVHSNDAHYFVFTVTNNAVRADFQTFSTGDIDLYLRQFEPPAPGPTDYDYASAIIGTGNEHIALTTNDSPRLAPGDWYLVVVNQSGGPIDYCIQASQTPAIDIRPITCTNAVTIPAFSVQYYDYAVSPDALRVLFQVTNINSIVGPANVDMYVGTNAFPDALTALDSSTNPGNADEYIAHSRAFLLNPPMTYRIAITNLEPVDVTYSLCVTETTNFISLANNVCFSNRLYAAGRRDAQYYSFDVPANAVQAEFSTASFGDVDLYLRRVPIPGQLAGEHDYASANAGVGNELIVITTNSAPVPLAPGLWYLVVTAQNDAAVDYCIKATQRDSIALTNNGVCVTNTLEMANDAHYYHVRILSNSLRADFMTLNADGNVDLYVQRFVPPRPANFDYQSRNGGTTNEMIKVDVNSSPVPLAPGDWYIAVVSQHPASVTYCVKVSQYPVLDPFNISLRITNGSPTHMDLGWNAFEFQRFHLEWTETLTAPWQPFTNANGSPIEFGPAGGVGTNFHHRDQPLVDPTRFYRLNILP